MNRPRYKEYHMKQIKVGDKVSLKNHPFLTEATIVGVRLKQKSAEEYDNYVYYEVSGDMNPRNILIARRDQIV